MSAFRPGALTGGSSARRAWLAWSLAAALCSACEPDPVRVTRVGLVFDPSEVDLGTSRTATLSMTNVGASELEQIELSYEPAVDSAGVPVPMVQVAVVPVVVDELDPGESVQVTARVEGTDDLTPGAYSTMVLARAGFTVVGGALLRFKVP